MNRLSGSEPCLGIHLKGLPGWDDDGVRRRNHHHTGGTFSESSIAHDLDRIDVSFDDPNLVAHVGLLLVGHPGGAPRPQGLIDTTVRLSRRVDGTHPDARC